MSDARERKRLRWVTIIEMYAHSRLSDDKAMKQSRTDVDLHVVDKDVGSELGRMKEMITRLDQEIQVREEEAEFIDDDIHKLKDRLREVNASLGENIQKYTKCEENNKEIVAFYEKLVENTKSLAAFINRQNSTLEQPVEN